MASSWADKIDSKRKRYNPEVEGYGNAQQWTGAFYERMGVKEAEQVLYGNDKSPRQILGLSDRKARYQAQAELDREWKEIQKAYRKLALATHPDRIHVTGMTKEAATEAFKVVSAAYSKLCLEFSK